ncbi:MAG TPA: hypothetical protein VL360_07080 [Gammaproteobacteria bacterium]|jgi:hypothetical protein|nr:hypothetical protein [Gammaproteobacteria bacterium]
MNKIIITLLLLSPCCAAAETLAPATIRGDATSKTRIVIDSIDGHSVNADSSELNLVPGPHTLTAYQLKSSGSMDSDTLIKVDLQWIARSGQTYRVQMEKRSQHMDGRVIDQQGRIISQHADQEVLPLAVNGFLGTKA